MHRSVLAATAAVASLGLMATSARYPLYAPQGRALPKNNLPPRKDKGDYYAFDRKGTRTIQAHA